MGAGGEFALVRQIIEQAIDRPAQPVKWGTIAHDHDLYVMLTDLAAQQRDLGAIREYAPKAQQLAERDNHQLYLAIIHRAMGVGHRLAREYDSAAVRLSQALEIFDSLGTRWQIGRTFAEYSELEQSRQNDAAARDYQSRALHEFESLHAGPDMAQIKARVA